MAGRGRVIAARIALIWVVIVSLFMALSLSLLAPSAMSLGQWVSLAILAATLWPLSTASSELRKRPEKWLVFLALRRWSRCYPQSTSLACSLARARHWAQPQFCHCSSLGVLRWGSSSHSSRRGAAFTSTTMRSNER